MKYFVVLIFSFLLLSTPLYAQDYKKHTVEKGETVVSIAKKYKITPYDIYRINPDAKNGIKENTVLLIPGTSKVPKAEPEKVKPTKVANTIHEVTAKETLFSLAKKYDVSVDDIKKANGTALDNGLQIGQKVIIPIKGSGVAAQVKAEKKEDKKPNSPSYFFHTVEAGETKYSIAKQYGMSLQLLEELNPEVKDTLPLGYKLKLDKKAVVEKDKTQPIPVAATKKAYADYTVQPKETVYSLTKDNDITEAEFFELNPQAKEGLKEGMVIKLPVAGGAAASTSTVATAPVLGNASKAISGLAGTLKKSETKDLALVLPFNLSRIESDTVRSKLLRSDKFLNMTLDFYAGALMAIDSAKVLGLPLKVKIIDAKETKSSFDAAGVAASVGGMDAVIGPFFPNNAESLASALASKGIPVISPLSKDDTKPYSNLFQSVPSPERVRLSMLDYLKTKGGNIIAVVDAKKASSKQFIKTNLPSAQFAPLSPDGTIVVEGLKNMLVKGKVNYVILETERSGMILGTTKTLVDALAEYQIQLVVLERYDAFDNDELPLTRLAVLKMLYPSVTNDSDTPEGILFGRIFKEKNNIMPNQFATRGFDVTFDAILRLFQQDSFKEVMTEKASEAVESKFDYASQNGGNYNTGVYILYYDQDLSTKVAQ
ncbi:LysM peptidoglycan-binding domain-containing protein [Flavobacterium sp. DG1-102-2]|uniref:LysM peptidoglycan-binding domain-containing protein n=1 Tax=Flavobacterium sp. DG1-102-2 TaxID=3081663 RepID=UPI002949E634|nr:LysM peptidoglycan-binding domain-containing protein [Flavobacterium sp. DG1-102-2]MDV6170098.1 LysM peptidoglycan-binding domain-containing protein [Flavobacterium sp. DG1-102-2]